MEGKSIDVLATIAHQLIGGNARSITLDVLPNATPVYIRIILGV